MQNTITTLNATDFWQNRLFETIQECHPYMLLDDCLKETESFIIQRANSAYEYYCKEKLAGTPDYEAKLNAITEVLLGGLIFSPTDFIQETLFEERGLDIQAPEELVDYYLMGEDLFQGINESIYDDFEKEQALKTAFLERFDTDDETA